MAPLWRPAAQHFGGSEALRRARDGAQEEYTGPVQLMPQDAHTDADQTSCLPRAEPTFDIT